MLCKFCNDAKTLSLNLLIDLLFAVAISIFQFSTLCCHRLKFKLYKTGSGCDISIDNIERIFYGFDTCKNAQNNPEIIYH